MFDSKRLSILSALVLTACVTDAGEWQQVPLDLPGTTDIIYLRQSIPNFVGTEQYRRLRVGDHVLELPVQMGGREPVNIYFYRDSTDAILRFDEFQGITSVDLSSLDISDQRISPDSLGRFVGTFVSPEIRDLRFIPASEGEPIDLDS